MLPPMPMPSPRPPPPSPVPDAPRPAAPSESTIWAPHMLPGAFGASCPAAAVATVVGAGSFSASSLGPAKTPISPNSAVSRRARGLATFGFPIEPSSPFARVPVTPCLLSAEAATGSSTLAKLAEARSLLPPVIVQGFHRARRSSRCADGRGVEDFLDLLAGRGHVESRERRDEPIAFAHVDDRRVACTFDRGARRSALRAHRLRRSPPSSSAVMRSGG